MSDTVWIRIAKDPLGNRIHDAISLGKHGAVLGDFAAPIPEELLEDPEFAKFFEVVDEDDVSDEEKKAAQTLMARNKRFAAEAKRNNEIRKRARERAIAERAAADAVVEMTDDFPDSDDD